MHEALDSILSPVKEKEKVRIEIPIIFVDDM
jgi:hypothetical protein